MQIEHSTITKLTLNHLKEEYALDPVSVILEDFEPGNGKIIIDCYGKSWSAHWGSMGSKDVATFFCKCDEHYIANKLSAISGGIPDYAGFANIARQEVIQRRRHDPFSLSRSDARDLYYEAIRFALAESHHDLDDQAATAIFGPEWWHEIPTKSNPAYLYLCRVIRAVQAGLKQAGLSEQPQPTPA